MLLGANLIPFSRESAGLVKGELPLRCLPEEHPIAATLPGCRAFCCWTWYTLRLEPSTSMQT